jgi:hypothetical protein
MIELFPGIGHFPPLLGHPTKHLAPVFGDVVAFRLPQAIAKVFEALPILNHVTSPNLVQQHA